MIGLQLACFEWFGSFFWSVFLGEVQRKAGDGSSGVVLMVRILMDGSEVCSFLLVWWRNGGVLTQIRPKSVESRIATYTLVCHGLPLSPGYGTWCLSFGA